MKSYSLNTTPIEVIAEAITEDFSMELVGEEAELLRKIVNIGIDGHLEAVTQSTFTWMPGKRLKCVCPKNDMLVILRRLSDNGDEVAMRLRTDILSVLGIEEI